MIDNTIASAKAAMRALARRWLWLHEEIISHDAELERLVGERAPALMASHGIATLTVAEMLILAATIRQGFARKRPLQSSSMFAPFLHPAAKPIGSA